MSLILGVSRTGLAMARDGHLPSALAAVHPRFGVPHRAEVAVGVLVAVVAAVADVPAAIAFFVVRSTGVLRDCQCVGVDSEPVTWEKDCSGGGTGRVPDSGGHPAIRRSGHRRGGGVARRGDLGDSAIAVGLHRSGQRR